MEQGISLVGIGLKDGKTIFNGTVGVGMWSVTQNVYPLSPSSAAATTPYHANLYSLGICCDPTDGTPNCPKECNGTGGDDRKVVLMEFPDAVTSPSEFRVKWTSTLGQI